MQDNKVLKSPSHKDELFEQMETRYGSAFVQDIRDHMRAAETREIHYLEMKQMWDVLSRFRGRVRHMIRHYRQWKVSYEREQDEIEKVYMAYDGIFARQQLHDAWKLYVTVNKDYHEMRRTYMATMCQLPHWSSRA